MKLDLWDVQTNQYLGCFDDEAEALVLVRTLIGNFGPAYADTLELGGVTAEGEALEPLSGASLVDRANEVLSARPNEREQNGVVIGSKGTPRGQESKKSMVAASSGSRGPTSEARSKKRQKQS